MTAFHILAGVGIVIASIGVMCALIGAGSYWNHLQ